jgi:uncharacterized protein YegP (UPF0339 family)
MIESIHIEKDKELEESQDYDALREAGLDYVQALASKFWTDYNVHDPGVTTLEQLCFSITDLGLRTGYDIGDIIAVKKDLDGNPVEDIKNFYSAAQALSCNPLTENDYRKLFIDIPGVKNAWLEPCTDHAPTVYIDCERDELTYEYKATRETLSLNGLYDVYIEFEKELMVCSDDSVEVQLQKTAQQTPIKQTIRDKFQAHRNLSEDLCKVESLPPEEVGICIDIETQPGREIEEVLAEIWYRLETFVSPDTKFYTIKQMFEKGKTVDDIFTGPLLQHGFIDEDELPERETEIHTSDIYQILLDIEGIRAVKKLLITNYIDGIPQTTGQKWCLNLSKDRAAKFSIRNSQITFFRDVIPFSANKDEALQKLEEWRAIYGSKRLKGHDTDLEIPNGTIRPIESFASIQNEYPQCYGIGPAGLNPIASENRKAQALQFKAYLLFFEQVLANYLSQLTNVNRLFSMNSDIEKTYFTQQLYGIRDLELLYKKDTTVGTVNQELMEDDDLFVDRRNRFLNHLIGRFSEVMTEYSLMMYESSRSTAGHKLIKDKLAFLDDYPEISGNRYKAHNYKLPGHTWDTSNIAGVVKRVSRLVGIENYNRRSLITKVDNCFDRYVDGALEFRFRLLSVDGDILLRSEGYVAKAGRENGIKSVIKHGVEDKFYRRKTSVNKKFFYNLKAANHEVIGTSLLYDTPEERDAAIQTMKEHLSREPNNEGMYVVEHILLRSQTNEEVEGNLVQDPLLPFHTEPNCCPCCKDIDPYSFRVSFVIPFWPERFKDMRFREFVERTIRKELPAHIFPKICWIDQDQMIEFDCAYQPWLEENAKANPDKTIRAKRLRDLIEILDHLKSVYPESRLHDCHGEDDGDDLILDRGMLGTFEDNNEPN